MIVLENVQKSFRRASDVTPVLDVKELRVAAGERVAVMGRSGSGKTTLLNLISGLVLPDRGRVEVDGSELTALSEPARDRFRARTCGFVFQAFHLLDGFSAVENVLLGASFAGRPVERGRAVELLAAVGLGERLDHAPSQLSAGQQARVALARALMNRPRVLLADEPTGSLDQETGKIVLELMLRSAAAEGVTVVCATHDREVAAALERVVRVEELA